MDGAVPRAAGENARRVIPRRRANSVAICDKEQVDKGELMVIAIILFSTHPSMRECIKVFQTQEVVTWDC